MDRISWSSQRPEDVGFVDHWIQSLHFAHYVDLLVPSSQKQQHALGWFAVECEAAGMTVISSVRGNGSQQETKWLALFRLEWSSCLKCSTPQEESRGLVDE
ncbi:hypothetical protein ATANTOWER_012762 [Ataeniobius toweri]|uniref:Uncharacterized protein n=1 Tax=Ataeniobius toweri TaxID=208326 RepID=A0ABU7B780_9TELE|nr:hypothetical protein [Ataeniobius toweri]